MPTTTKTSNFRATDSQSHCHTPLALRIHGTEHDGHIVRLSSDQCTIGSGDHCTLRLCAQGVGGLHCIVVRNPHGMTVKRLGPNTWLNGQKFQSAPLVSGDRLRVGTIEFEVLGDTTSRTDPPKQSANPSQDKRQDHHGDHSNPSVPQPNVENRILAYQEKIESERAKVAHLSEVLSEVRATNHSRVRRLVQQLRENANQEKEQTNKERDDLEQWAQVTQQQAEKELAELQNRREEFAQHSTEMEAKLQERLAFIEQSETDILTQQERLESEWQEHRKRMDAELSELAKQRAHMESEQCDSLEARELATKDQIDRLAKSASEIRSLYRLRVRRLIQAIRDHRKQEQAWTARSEAWAEQEAEWAAQKEAWETCKQEWETQEKEWEACKQEWAEQEDAWKAREEEWAAQNESPAVETVDVNAELEQGREKLEAELQQRREALEAEFLGHREKLDVVAERLAEQQLALQQKYGAWEVQLQQREQELANREKGEAPSQPETARQSISARAGYLSAFSASGTDQALGQSPDVPAEPAATSNASETTKQTDEDSIEDYMAQLLKRVRAGGASSETNPSQSSACKPSPLSRPSTTTPTAPATPIAPVSSRMPTQETPANFAPQPREIADSDRVTPAVFPVDLKAMREIANDSARMAIDQHTRKRWAAAASWKLIVVLLAFLSCVALLCWGNVRNSITFSAVTTSVIVAMYWGLQWAVLFRQTRSHTTQTPDSQDQP